MIPSNAYLVSDRSGCVMSFGSVGSNFLGIRGNSGWADQTLIILERPMMVSRALQRQG